MFPARRIGTCTGIFWGVGPDIGSGAGWFFSRQKNGPRPPSSWGLIPRDWASPDSSRYVPSVTWWSIILRHHPSSARIMFRDYVPVPKSSVTRQAPLSTLLTYPEGDGRYKEFLCGYLFVLEAQDLHPSPAQGLPGSSITRRRHLHQHNAIRADLLCKILPQRETLLKKPSTEYHDCGTISSKTKPDGR